MRKVTILLSLLIFQFVLISTAVAATPGGWSVGVYENRGSYVVETDNGTLTTTGAGVGITGRHWLTGADALGLAGNFQTAGDRNFQLNTSFLRHFDSGPVRPFVGPGAKWADSEAGGDNLVALEAQAGFYWELQAEDLSLAVSAVPAMITLAPETDVYAGRTLRLEVFYNFD